MRKMYAPQSYYIYFYSSRVGLNRTGHMSFLKGKDRTPKFAGQVLPDRTESGLIFLNILQTCQLSCYYLSQYKVPEHKFDVKSSQTK